MDKVREAISDLRHSADVDYYSDEQEAFLRDVADRLEAALSQQAESAEPVAYYVLTEGGSPMAICTDAKMLKVLEKADAKLQPLYTAPQPAVPEGWHKALVVLSNAERHYRNTHDLHGSSDLKTGRAWDLLRRAGDKARDLLAAAPEAPNG